MITNTEPDTNLLDEEFALRRRERDIASDRYAGIPVNVTNPANPREIYLGDDFYVEEDDGALLLRDKASGQEIVITTETRAYLRNFLNLK